MLISLPLGRRGFVVFFFHFIASVQTLSVDQLYCLSVTRNWKCLTLFQSCKQKSVLRYAALYDTVPLFKEEKKKLK